MENETTAQYVFMKNPSQFMKASKHNYKLCCPKCLGVYTEKKYAQHTCDTEYKTTIEYPLSLQAIQTIEKNRKAAAAAHKVEQEMNQQLIVAAEAELVGGNSNSHLPEESNIPDTFVTAITEKEITTRGAFTFFDDREDPKAMVACLEEPELEWQQDLKAPPGAGEGQQDHCREARQESEVDSGVEDTTPSKEKVKKKKKAKKSKADIEGGSTELTEDEEESEKKMKKK